MMAQIAKVEVTNLPGFGPVLMPGPVGWQHGQTWTLNPSYMPVFVFERLGKVDHRVRGSKLHREFRVFWKEARGTALQWTG